MVVLVVSPQVTELATHFDSYSAVPKVGDLQRTISGTREALRRQVRWGGWGGGCGGDEASHL
jgi:hypothetical protein